MGMIGNFSVAYMVRAKSLPTTQVTTGDTDWDLVLQRSESRNEQDRLSCPTETPSHIDERSMSRGHAMRPHGLLTPHASITEKSKYRDFYDAQSSLGMTPTTRDGSQAQETQFVTPRESPLSSERGPSNIQPAPTSEPNACSSGHISYVSVGLQTSLPCAPPACTSTPTTPPSATPRASKRIATPEYVHEGERLARELSDDLTHLAQEKRRLKRSLARIERREKALRSLLIPCSQLSGDAGEVGIKDGTTATDFISPSSQRRERCHQVAPLTPASSEHEWEAKSQGKPTASPELASPMLILSSNCSGKSRSTFLTAKSGSSDGTPVRGGDNGTASPDGLLCVPSYTFAEGSSTTSSVSSPEDHARLPHNDSVDLAPNPIRDPSSCLVWFDLETTDAVRPAASIRILEVSLFVSDKNYQRLDGGRSFIVHWPLSAEEIACEMSDKVREMHEKSGLLADYKRTPPKERLTLAQVERRLCKYLERHDITSNGRAIMAGASVAFDRGMVRQHMEKLSSYFSHQIFDTTTLWHVVRRKYNRTKRFSETCVHRAMDDILESCREARLYSELLFKPPGEVHWPPLSSQGI